MRSVSRVMRDLEPGGGMPLNNYRSETPVAKDAWLVVSHLTATRTGWAATATGGYAAGAIRSVDTTHWHGLDQHWRGGV